MGIDAKSLKDEAKRHEKIAEALRTAAREIEEADGGGGGGPKGRFPELQEMLKAGPMRAKDIIMKMGISRAALYQWKKKHGAVVESKKGTWSLKK